jgi:hypothetical protein
LKLNNRTLARAKITYKAIKSGKENGGLAAATNSYGQKPYLGFAHIFEVSG